MRSTSTYDFLLSQGKSDNNETAEETRVSQVNRHAAQTTAAATTCSGCFVQWFAKTRNHRQHIRGPTFVSYHCDQWLSSGWHCAMRSENEGPAILFPWLQKAQDYHSSLWLHPSLKLSLPSSWFIQDSRTLRNACLWIHFVLFRVSYKDRVKLVIGIFKINIFLTRISSHRTT